MAWNGSQGTTPIQSTPKRRNRSFYGILVGLIVAIGGLAICCLMLGRKTNEPSHVPSHHAKTNSAKIVAVAQPIAHKKQKAPPSQEKTEKEIIDEKVKYYESVFGRNMPQGLKTHIYYLKNPPKRIFSADDKYSYVKHHSEKQLASFLTMAPGTYFIQCPQFDESFDTDFVAAIRDDIVIDSTDSHEVKEMKKAIIDFKNEIADICKTEGKLPSQILNDHAMSLFELGKFQQNMQTQLQEIYNSPKYTDTDVKDFCTAANMMLKDNGLEPMPYPDLTERTLELQYNLTHADEEGLNHE